MGVLGFGSGTARTTLNDSGYPFAFHAVTKGVFNSHRFSGGVVDIAWSATGNDDNRFLNTC